MWILNDAVELAKEVEAVAPTYGYHVALTGGLLYKAPPPRKDCDLVLYRDGNGNYDKSGLLEALENIVNFVKQPKSYIRVHKATWRGMPVDIFLVENDGSYGGLYSGPRNV